jgi:hypothetical protein
LTGLFAAIAQDAGSNPAASVIIIFDMEKKQKIIFCKNCNNPLCKVVDWQGGSIIIVCSNCHAKNKIENSIVVVASKME